jgi:CDP-6-deoxy-D-xylo-4-hexulose-3-dehydrase
MSKNEELISSVHQNIQSYCDKNFVWDFNPKAPIVRLHEPTFGAEEINAAISQMLTTQVTMGKEVRNFEEQYASKFGNKYGVMSNSGSSANLLAVAALVNPNTSDRLKPGDEVIVPALSWATTVWPVIQYGLVPVIVDCDPNTYNFDLEKLEKAISAKTRAIVLVHVYGNPCNMSELMPIVDKHGLFLIEDCCESMGAYFNDKAVGTFGDMGTFSFYYSHHITTFEGGITVTNNFDFAETLRVLRAHGWSREADEKDKYIKMYPEIDPRFIFINLGYNLRPTEVQAVMGQKQLPKLDELVNKRRTAYDRYRKNLNKFSDRIRFQEEQVGGRSSWFGFGVTLKDQCKFSPKDLTRHLNAAAIETRPIIAGNIARHPVMQQYEHRVFGSLENSDCIMSRGFAVACHHAMNDQAVDYVCDQISDFLNKN